MWKFLGVFVSPLFLRSWGEYIEEREGHGKLHIRLATDFIMWDSIVDCDFLKFEVDSEDQILYTAMGFSPCGVRHSNYYQNSGFLQINNWNRLDYFLCLLISILQKYQHRHFDAFFSVLSCGVSVPFYTAFLPFLFWVRTLSHIFSFCFWTFTAIPFFLFISNVLLLYGRLGIANWLGKWLSW